MRKFSFQQQVLAGFVVALFFIFLLGVLSFMSARELQKDTSMIDHSHQVISKTDRIESLLINCETSQRGYIISGNLSYLDLYNQFNKIIIPELDRFKILVYDNPEQVKRIDSLSKYSIAKLNEMQYVIDLRDRQGIDAARNRVLSNTGKSLMEKIRNISENIIFEENKLLTERKAKGERSENQTFYVTISGAAIILIIVLVLLSYIIKTFKQQKNIEENVREANIELEKISEENILKNWLLTGTTALNEVMSGEQEVNNLVRKIITEIAKYVDAQVGAIYLTDPNSDQLKLVGSYAHQFRKTNQNYIQIGEGLVGQAAFEKRRIIFSEVPNDYIKIVSGIGEVSPKVIVIQPFMYENEVKGMIELGFANEVTAIKLDYIDLVIDSMGIVIDSSQARVQLRLLFEQTQQQAEELEAQQEELRTTNDELVNKTELLQSSEEELRVQQEELKEINSELEEKSEQLEERNHSMEQAREAISIKAQELELTSKYKSEFLANMSHELRTPLNSILILARILKENKNNNLSEEQVKYASVIQNAGGDLLTLINDILDLSKIESGKIDLNIEDISIAEIKQDIEALFNEVANNKSINFSVLVNDNAPVKISSDKMRLEQIIKNLLSNAFKFTPEKGNVSIEIGIEKNTEKIYLATLDKNQGKDIVYFSVKDTGIGIPEEKQKQIFDAFQQADGATTRKFGGTGLGLSISRELANILGGEIKVRSTPKIGSIFTFYVPLEYIKPESTDINHEPKKNKEKEVTSISNISTSLSQLKFDDNEEHTLLIIEDDPNFADILKDYAIERGFKALIADRGDTGLQMAGEHLPSAIVLDIMLPVMDGWTVLKKLKENPRTKNIPVHLMSAGDEKLLKAHREGAIGFLKKPVEKEKLDDAFDKLIASGTFKLNKVLLIEDHKIQSEDLKRQLVAHGVEVKQAFDGKEAIKILNDDSKFDCIILDVNLPDISGLDLLDQIKADDMLSDIPVIINTAMELDQEKMASIMKHTHALVIKNKMNDRLLDEVNLFMNKLKAIPKNSSKSSSPANKARPAATLEKALYKKTVLIVDDDMRNIFALSSVLQHYEMVIEIAYDGKQALKKLNENPKTHIVLMDIMMPEMDGYEATQEIRKQTRFAHLPVIALTAKAMKNDREKCIEAGANDYISKPVDIDKLVSMMRVWLS